MISSFVQSLNPMYVPPVPEGEEGNAPPVVVELPVIRLSSWRELAMGSVNVLANMAAVPVHPIIRTGLILSALVGYVTGKKVDECQRYSEVISSAKDLKNMENSNQNFVLVSDIDCSGENTTCSAISGFKGGFNGRNHKITGLQECLFDSVSDQADVRNLTLENANIKSNGTKVGVLACDVMKSTVENIIVRDSRITATGGGSSVGAVVGSSYDVDYKNVTALNNTITDILDSSSSNPTTTTVSTTVMTSSLNTTNNSDTANLTSTSASNSTITTTMLNATSTNTSSSTVSTSSSSAVTTTPVTTLTSQNTTATSNSTATTDTSTSTPVATTTTEAPTTTPVGTTTTAAPTTTPVATTTTAAPTTAPVATSTPQQNTTVTSNLTSVANATASGSNTTTTLNQTTSTTPVPTTTPINLQPNNLGGVIGVSASDKGLIFSIGNNITGRVNDTVNTVIGLGGNEQELSCISLENHPQNISTGTCNLMSCSATSLEGAINCTLTTTSAPSTIKLVTTTTKTPAPKNTATTPLSFNATTDANNTIPTNATAPDVPTNATIMNVMPLSSSMGVGIGLAVVGLAAAAGYGLCRFFVKKEPTNNSQNPQNRAPEEQIMLMDMSAERSGSTESGLSEASTNETDLSESSASEVNTSEAVANGANNQAAANEPSTGQGNTTKRNTYEGEGLWV